MEPLSLRRGEGAVIAPASDLRFNPAEALTSVRGGGGAATFIGEPARRRLPGLREARRKAQSLDNLSAAERAPSSDAP